MPKIDTDTEEGKAVIQEMVDAQVKALKDKNSELLASQKDLKDKMKTFQEQIDEINAEKDKALEEAAAKGGDVETLKKQLETKHAKDIEKLTSSNTLLQQQLNAVLVEGGLSDALAKANIAPQFIDAAKSLLKSGATIAEKDGKLSAVIEGKPINEYVTEWSQSETGKHFVAAGTNSGGGAKGSNGNGKAVTETTYSSPVARLTAAREAQSNS